MGAVAVAAVLFELLRFGWPAFQSFVFRYLGFLFKPKERSQVAGSTYLCVSSLVVFAVFPQSLAPLAVLTLSLGDSTAAIVGQRWGRIRIGDKSLEGSLAFVIIGLSAGLVLAAIGRGPSPLAATIGVLMAALVEAAPLPVDDNLLIPPAAATAMMVVGSLGG